MKKLNEKVKKHRFSILIVILGLAFISINLVAFSSNHVYTSDETHLQTMFDTDTIISGQPKWFGISSFVFKLPFIFLARQFTNYTKFGIFLPTLIVNIIGSVLFLTAICYFIKRYNLSKLSVLPSLWILTLGGGFIYYLFNLNSRNIEVGIIFSTIALADYFINSRKKINNKLLIILSILILTVWGFIFVSDNFYLYMFILPFTLFSGFSYFKNRDKKYRYLLMVSIASLFICAVFNYIYIKLNFINYNIPLRFGDYTQIVQKINNLPLTFLNFTNNNFFGMPITKLSTIIRLAAAAIFSFGFYGGYRILKDNSLEKYDLIKIFPLLLLFNLVIWTFSDRSFDYYFILIPFLLALCAGYAMDKIKNIKYPLALVILILIIINFGLMAKSYIRSAKAQSRPNDINYALIDKIKSRGINYGYALFWDSTINTYLSKNSIKFIQSKCINNEVYISRWYLSSTDLKTSDSKTFYLFNTEQPEECTAEIIMRQFGKPEEVIDYKNFKIFIFPYDIGTKIK